ncbi:MAG TPA: [FeFe] hydrogenase, group A [Candidatus Paceibacterota bacterium]|nr:[FeFe] hydrogenase, group A [Verrucomicrobiota bacterium]HRY49316.1 [FeFe] hydrogenase, group A [Candidatus Paceibacterota bacterium]HRZ99393.1 [FeFe] hydrogenase, group A [Candidatus Paceibacterota bacterium]
MKSLNSIRTLYVDGREVEIEGERNLLEVIRKAGIELPTFCYHSDLSVYGACRLCLVEVEGRGIQGACSTPPEPGLKIRTQTAEIREIRKIAVELLLANHDQQCPTCPKNSACQLQEVARKLDVRKVRFQPVHRSQPVDDSSLSLVRDPNKCVLCGDCVRLCAEIQGIGAIDFVRRGHEAAVMPAFGKDLGQVECVNCGQCAAVCPTGALTPKSEVESVWRALMDPAKTVVVQIAPAVRVALGEAFGMPAGMVVSGQIVAALRRLGFKRIFDTSFSADLTVIEEAHEFLQRKKSGERLPQFTSCCPGWVKFAEQYYPEFLPHLSSCKSPQQMLGALCKELLPSELGISRQNLVVVSIMPCTAKKFEARRPEFIRDGLADVDFVLTTQELARMIEEAGVRFQKLQPESFDMPMGFKTGAGIIFGNSGGVTEAVLRYAVEKMTGRPLENPDFHRVRGENGMRLTSLNVDGAPIHVAVVHGLNNARRLIEQLRRGECQADLVEVMACPGGCIGGAGQPVTRDLEVRRLRCRSLYDADKTLDLHKSQDNFVITEYYQKHLGEVGGRQAHRLLHTHYQNRRRIAEESIRLGEGQANEKLKVEVCVGTNCFVKGSQGILQALLHDVERQKLQDRVEISASFCFERCDHGPTVRVAGQALRRCTVDTVRRAITQHLQQATTHDHSTSKPGDIH